MSFYMTWVAVLSRTSLEITHSYFMWSHRVPWSTAEPPCVLLWHQPLISLQGFIPLALASGPSVPSVGICHPLVPAHPTPRAKQECSRESNPCLWQLLQPSLSTESWADTGGWGAAGRAVPAARIPLLLSCSCWMPH